MTYNGAGARVGGMSGHSYLGRADMAHQSCLASATSAAVTAEGGPSSLTLAKLAEQSVHRLGDLPGLGQ